MAPLRMSGATALAPHLVRTPGPRRFVPRPARTVRRRPHGTPFRRPTAGDHIPGRRGRCPAPPSGGGRTHPRQPRADRLAVGALHTAPTVRFHMKPRLRVPGHHPSFRLPRPERAASAGVASTMPVRPPVITMRRSPNRRSAPPGSTPRRSCPAGRDRNRPGTVASGTPPPDPGRRNRRNGRSRYGHCDDRTSEGPYTRPATAPEQWKRVTRTTRPRRTDRRQRPPDDAAPQPIRTTQAAYETVSA